MIDADDAAVLRRLDGDSRQLGGGGDQRIERQVDPRGDDPALVGAGIVDDVKGRGSAEIDDDEVAGERFVGRDGIERPVGADILRLVDIERDRPRRPA